MKTLFLILIAVFVLAGMVNAQGWAWNYEDRTKTSVKDSATWANATVTIYYQVHPQITTRDTLFPKASRYWAGKGGANKRTKLVALTTAMLDSTLRYVPIKEDSLLMGSYMRLITDDGTNKDTSQAVQIKGKSKFQAWYYMDDVSTNLLRQFLLLTVQ